MFRNYLKIAWRNLKNNPLFSTINIFGLSLGVAIALVLFVFVRHELGFDQQRNTTVPVYRVILHTTEASYEEVWANVPPVLAPTLKNELPGLKFASRILKNGFGENAYIHVGNTSYVEDELYWCDPEIVDILQIQLLSGNSNELHRPNTIALSQHAAERYFGTIDPLGKRLKVDNRTELEVVAVYKNQPKNSSYRFNAIGSFNTTPFSRNPGWGNASFETLVGFEKAISSHAVAQQLQKILDKHVPKEEQWYSFSLQPFEKIHLYSAGFSDSYAARIGDIREIINLSLLAIVILCIACINYMNLTTARSQKRSKEIGINKTLGANKSVLVAQFYIETAVITIISIGIGGCFAVLALPWFNQLTGQHLEQALLFNGASLFALSILWIILTLVAGSYPALYLSRFSPRSVLSPSQKQSGGALLVRKGLVILQFTASAILIVCVTIVYQQLGFIKNKNLGFESENVIAISTASIKDQKQFKALKSQFENLGQITSVAMAQGFPGMGVSLNSLYKNENDTKGIDIHTNMADSEIIDVLDLQLLAGKSLANIKHENDTTLQVVVNKKAIAYLGYSPEEAINKEIMINRKHTIVGVVDDFNFASLHAPIGAYAFTNSKREPKSYLLVRFKGFSPELLNLMETVFNRVAPDAVFDYSFLHNNIEKLYEKEQRIANTGIFFCILAIVIACLGLFGLAAFMTERRRKEISIRKVLGATITNIIKIISIDFVKLVLIALLIAFPMAFWLMENWLQNYAYSIDISWFVFAFSALLVFSIALATVGLQAVRAAIANPVKSLQAD